MAAMAQAAVTEGMEKGMEDQNMMERIRSAVSARSEHIKNHSDSLTMVSIRRLLEEDLGLEASALNAYKKQITQLVDQIMKPEDQEPKTGPEAEESKPNSTQENADSDQKEPSDNNDLVSPSKEVEERSEVNGTEAGDKDGSIGSPAASNEKQKRTKAVKEETKSGEQKKKVPKSKPKSSKKRLPGKKLEVTDESEEEVSKGSVASEEEEAEKRDSPAKKPSKLQSKASDLKPVSNKLVEQLKQMIKSCGMSIPPSIYKRVKQAPENKRDSALVSELESILQKEGLNRHSSEKEIKAVKKNKDKQKDLEGIDVGNIITEGRPRRQQEANDFYDIPVAAKAKRRRKAVVVSDDERSDISKEAT